MITVTNPERWLREQLPDYVPADALKELLERYADQKQRYARAVKIRELERRIRTAERFTQTPDRDAQIGRWKTKLATLKEKTL